MSFIENFAKIWRQHRVFLCKIAIHLMAFLPLVFLYLLAFDDQLGADPVEEVIHFTGIGAFNLLLLSLCITPLAQKFKQAYLIQTRRLLGLYAFFYALLHLINFLAFEVQFDMTLFWQEIIERPYITVGMAALIILLLLAITSLNKLKRKMGKTWQQLHNTVYVAGILIALHFLWSVKSDIVEPSIYIIMLTLLLLLRKKKFKRGWLKNKKLASS